MKVYLVMSDDYSDKEVVAIYSSETRADERAATINAVNEHFERTYGHPYAFVEPWQVDYDGRPIDEPRGER